MNSALEETLGGLKTDPTLVIKLYEQLFNATYFTIVNKGTESTLSKTEFLTYDTKDNLRELPLFTNEEFIFKDIPAEAIIVKLSGKLLWERLLNLIETGRLEAAINPIQPHGIRMTREMILGMVTKYS